MKRWFVSFRILFHIVLCVLFACKGEPTSQASTETRADTLIGTPVTTPATNIWAVFQDSQGAFWFGSNGSGAYRLKAGQWIQYTTADGLVSDAIRGFQEDTQGLLYIETPKGISVFNGKAFQTLEVDPNPDSEWEASPTDLWFYTNGTAKDVYRYNGESLQELKLPRMER